MNRFAFGKNWDDFSRRLQYEDYLAAKESLKKLVPDLQGKTFLDIGCGSKLFPIAESAQAEEIADAVKRLAEDRETYRKMSDAARKQAEMFSWKSVAHQYSQLYKRTLYRES